MLAKPELVTRLLKLESRLRDHDQASPVTADHFLYQAVIELLDLVGHVLDKTYDDDTKPEK